MLVHHGRCAPVLDVPRGGDTCAVPFPGPHDLLLQPGPRDLLGARQQRRHLHRRQQITLQIPGVPRHPRLRERRSVFFPTNRPGIIDGRSSNSRYSSLIDPTPPRFSEQAHRCEDRPLRPGLAMKFVRLRGDTESSEAFRETSCV